MNNKGKRYVVDATGGVVVADRPTPVFAVTVTPPPPKDEYPTHPNGRPIGHYL